MVSAVGGRAANEIGNEPGLKVETVEWYLARLYTRFDVQTRGELRYWRSEAAGSKPDAEGTPAVNVTPAGPLAGPG